MDDLMPELFEGRSGITAHALCIGQRIDLRRFEQGHVLARSPLLVSVGASGCTVLFRYGVVVVFGLSGVEELSFLEEIASLVHEPFAKVERETVEVVFDPQANEGVSNSQVVLHDSSWQRLQLLAHVLAKSVALGFYEQAIGHSFDRIEPLVANLQKGRHARHQVKELTRYIGDALSIQSKMVGRAEIAEKPELLWEHTEHERLYARLEDEYELRERYDALVLKLELIARTAETLLGLLQEGRTLRVEWYIVILIVIEILLTLYELWWPF